MSDEISLNKGWTLDAYIAHNESIRVETDRRYEQRFVAQEKAVDAALTSAKEAVLKAEAASDKRFEGVNEFRATLSDQATKFASAEKVNDLASRMDRWEGKTTGTDASFGKLISVVGAIGVIVAVVAAILKWG